MNIHLIRHGKTMANEQNLYCGANDLPLSEAGVADLMRLRELDIYPKPAESCLYFTSGLLRAEQTLNLIYGSVHRIVLPQFAEYNFGSFEMKSHEELKDHEEYQAWISDETGHIACPSGDSKFSFLSRVLEGYKLLMQNVQSGSDAIVVCHGGVIVCFMEHLFHQTRQLYEWLPEPGRGYTLTYTSCGDKLHKII